VTTFSDLAGAQPALRRYEVEAEQAARNGWLGWPSWVAHYADFLRLVPVLAERRIDLDHLIGVFRAARLLALRQRDRERRECQRTSLGAGGPQKRF
jgi:hypothetical protein